MATNIWTQRLIRLQDGGSPFHLYPGMFGWDQEEGSPDALRLRFLALNRTRLDALEVGSDLEARPDGLHIRLRPGPSVGVVPLRGLTAEQEELAILVTPRTGWGDVGLMMRHTGWRTEPRLLDFPAVDGIAPEIPPWIFDGPRLHRVRRLLDENPPGQGLSREVRSHPRGHILWTRYATHHARVARPHEFPCRFPHAGPDPRHRGQARGAIERIRASLLPHAYVDGVARLLLDEADHLLAGMGSTPAIEGIQDGRGLAGITPHAGLPWTLSMRDLFRQWVLHLARKWARTFGGDVTEVAPADLVVRRGKRVYVFLARYDGYFRGEDVQDRHDANIKDALAAAAGFEGDPVTAVLVYPTDRPGGKRAGIVSETRVGARRVEVAVLGTSTNCETLPTIAEGRANRGDPWPPRS